MLIGFLLIGFLIYWLISQKQTDVVSKTNRSIEALEIAKARLASGEITIDEYEIIKNAIR